MAGRAPGAGRSIPTLADVAQRAGVSVGTVSKALNGRGQLRPQTRERVAQAASELGFEPNALARSLHQGRTYTVGILTTDSIGRFSIPVMLGIEDGLGAGQLSTMLCDGRDDPLREQHYVRMLLGRRVDGIVVTGRRRDPRPSIGALPIPVVYVLVESQDPQDLSITYDDEQGGALAVQHLLRTGRRRIAHVTGPQRHASARLREAGARTALAAAGLELAGGGTLWGEWSEMWGREAAHILLRSGEDVDAVFCGSDQVARGVSDALREAGRRVPDDTAVAGFDNWDVMAEACRPPLTTVDPNLHELGKVAARTLLEMIDGGPARSGRVLLPCDLVVRRSTSASP
jgi:LacI family transcriptional regulator